MKNKLITKNIINVLLFLPIYGIYVSFGSYFNFCKVQLNELFFKPIFRYDLLTVKNSTAIFSIKLELLQESLNGCIFILSIILLIFLLLLLYRKRKWSYQDADFMHFPIVLSFMYLIYSFIYGLNYLLKYWGAYEQHVLFTILYYLFFFSGLLVFLIMILIAKDYKLKEFKKVFFICVIFLLFLYFYGKIFFFSYVYTYDVTCESSNFFSSLDEQKKLLNSLVSLYGLGVFCSTEEMQGVEKDPCIEFRETKEYYCNISKQVSKIPSVKGGDFRLRTSINTGSMLFKTGTKFKCSSAIQNLYECLIKHDLKAEAKPTRSNKKRSYEFYGAKSNK